MPTKEQKATVLFQAVLEGESSVREWNEYVESAARRPDLKGVRITGKCLKGMTFRECELDGASFEECLLPDVCFDDASVRHMRFSGSNMQGATFVRADATHADFMDCHLVGANFSWCNLQQANLAGVDLSQVAMWKTDLRNAKYPRFEPTSKQHFLSTGTPNGLEGHSEVPLKKVLKTLGAMIGVPYRWSGRPLKILVCLPEEIHDPAQTLNEILDRHRLVALPHTDEAGQITSYSVRRQ